MSEEQAGPGGDRRDRYSDLIHGSFGGLAGAILFAIMMMTVVDVFGRYLLNAPIPGGYEVTQFLMAAMIFAGLPSVSRQESHITIDLLDPLTPQAAIRPRQIAVNLAGALVMAVVAWQLWELAERIVDYGDVTEYLQMPRGPIIYYMSVLSGLASLVLIANVVRYVRGADAAAPGLI